MAFAPEVSLLWEPGDPAGRLTERFGFAGASAAADWVADCLDLHWGATVTSCDRVVISAWNAMAWVSAEGQELIAKWSAIPPWFARLRDAARVVTWLATCDVPVAAPRPARDGQLSVEMANPAKGRLRSRLPLPGSRFLLAVLPVLGGELLDVGDLALVDDAGRMLARLHTALAAYPHSFARSQAENREQLVHNDFRAANILHDGTRITGVLDFEEVDYGTRVQDLGKAAVLLGTHYRDWVPTGPEVRDRFLAAYTGVAPLDDDEWRELDARMAAELAAPHWRRST